MWVGEYILDENGDPQPEYDVLKWAMWYEYSHKSKGKDNRILAQDRIGNVAVSTIFLGLDQTFGLIPGPPTLWETMIFRGEHDGWQQRYVSRDQALEGHAEAVAMVKGKPMSYNPLKRDSSWWKVQPGCYVDPEGCGHLFPDEVLAYLSVTHPEAGFDPNSPRDYEMVVEVFSKLLRELAPNVKDIIVVKHERQDN